MTDDTEKEIERITQLAGLDRPVDRSFFANSYRNQASGCVMSEDVNENTAKDILRRIARHIAPGDWNNVIEDHPNWKGLLDPIQSTLPGEG